MSDVTREVVDLPLFTLNSVAKGEVEAYPSSLTSSSFYNDNAILSCPVESSRNKAKELFLNRQLSVTNSNYDTTSMSSEDIFYCRVCLTPYYPFLLKYPADCRGLLSYFLSTDASQQGRGGIGV